MTDPRPLALAYARLGYARQLSIICEDAIKRRGNEPLFVLLHALAQAREGGYNSAIREVETLKSRRDSEFAVHTALIVLHSSSGSPASAWSASTAAKASALERATPSALYLAAQFLFLTGGNAEAEELVDRALGAVSGGGGSGVEVSLLALKGWLGATAGLAPGSRALPLHASAAARLKREGPYSPTKAHNETAVRAIPSLESAVLPTPVAQRDLEAVCALAALYERTGSYEEAGRLLGEASASAPWFLPAVAARGCCALRTDDWDGAWEAAVTLLDGDGDNVEGHRLAALCVLVREGPGARAAGRMDELAATLLRVEPRAPRLLVDCARPLAKLSGRSRGVLSGCIRLCEAAARVGGGWAGAEYSCELGEARLLAGDSSGASRAFGEASKADEGDAGAVLGLIGVQVASGAWEDAGAQLDMFLMVSESLVGAKPPEVCLLEARVAGARGGRREALDSLSEAVRAHGEAVASAVGWYPPPGSDSPMGKALLSARVACEGGEKGWGVLSPLPPPTVDPHAYFALLKPDLLLTIAREYLVAGGEAGSLGTGPLHSSPSAAAGSGETALSPTPSLILTLHPECVDLSSPAVSSGLSVLARLTNLVPAAMPGWLLSAVVFSKCGEQSRAQSAIARVLASDGGYTEAHLLLASTALLSGAGDVALASLETALAHCFAVREWAVYKLLKSRALGVLGRWGEVVTLAGEALGLGFETSAGGTGGGASGVVMRPRGSVLSTPSVPNSTSTNNSSTTTSSTTTSSSSSSSAVGSSTASTLKDTSTLPPEQQFSLSDTITMYVLLVQALSRVGRRRDAQETIATAQALLKSRGGGGASEVTPSHQQPFNSYRALEDRLLVARAGCFLEDNDVDGALDALATIQPTSPSFPSARSFLADIHLKHRRDVSKYLGVFTTSVTAARKAKVGAAQNAKAVTTLALALEELGHAYLRVGEPEEAVEAYTEAKAERRVAAVLEANAGGGSYTSSSLPPTAAEDELSRAIGKALVSSHDYRRAVTFYNGILSPPSSGRGGASVTRSALRADFTELLLKLHLLEQAQGLIEESLKDAGGGGGAVKDVFSLKFAVSGLRMLSKVSSAARESEGAKVALRQALNHQRMVLDAARGGMSGKKRDDGGKRNEDTEDDPSSSSSSSSSGLSLELEKRTTSDLCLELGALLSTEEALPFFTEAVQLCEESEEAHLALAGCHLSRGDMESCRRSLLQVTNKNPGSTRAVLMLVDVLFREKDTASALSSLSTLLEKQPTNYGVMLKLGMLLKRERRLTKELPRLLKAAVASSPTAPNDSGYKFMQGLGARAANKPAAAIKFFSSVRNGEGGDGKSGSSGGGTRGASSLASGRGAPYPSIPATSQDWGIMACEQMVRIFIAPDGEPLWVLKEPDEEGDNSTAEMLSEAERLLQDAPPSARSSTLWEVLHCQIAVAQNTKESLDEAITRLAAVLEVDPDNIPALGTLSAAFFNGGEPAKARSQLKRLLKLPAAGPGEFADESVDAWLMLAAINADSGKPDMAVDCVKRALALDSGAGRAWEYLGTLAEKELRYTGSFVCVCVSVCCMLSYFPPSPLLAHALLLRKSGLTLFHFVPHF